MEKPLFEIKSNLPVTWAGISIVGSVLIALVSLTFSIGTLYAEWQHVQRDHLVFAQKLFAIEETLRELQIPHH